MKNRRVEIIILPVNDEIEQKKEFNPEDFIGTLKIKDVDKSLKDMRDEWDRI